MLDASFSDLNPTWAHTAAFGDLLRCRFPDPMDHAVRQLRICAVSDIDTHRGAIFVELVPAIHEHEQAPEPGDISLEPMAQHRGLTFRPTGLWLRPDIAERFYTAHQDFRFAAWRRSPIVDRLVGDELRALEQVHARHLALRAAHIADRRARRAARRRAR